MDGLAVSAILEGIKKGSFTDQYQASDEEAMGLLISKYFHWDGLSILKAFYEALEDANFHTENEVIQGMIDKVEAAA